jgi:hypothetical protein
MNDTQPKTEQHYQEMLLSKSPLERLQMASRMFVSGRKLVIAGILKENPHLNPSQLRARLFLRLYGGDFTSTDIERIIKKIPNMQ